MARTKPHSQPAPRRRRRAGPMAPEARTAAILEAAGAVFIERGFAGARIEEVAHRAGIAKGTVYLHFESKAALFRALARQLAAPPLQAVTALLGADELSSADMLRRMLDAIRREVLETDRRLLLRLLLTEGHRFPELAASYHDEVVSRAMALVRAVVARGVARGEFRGDALARFPQLFAAPMLLAVLWEGLFAARAPLDVASLLDAHLELVLNGLRGERP